MVILVRMLRLKLGMVKRGIVVKKFRNVRNMTSNEIIDGINKPYSIGITT